MSAEPAVVARGLRKSFDGRVAVDGIDFAVEPGTCFGFLGPNGAGKTTTMKMIYGLATVGDGELRVLGLDVAEDPRGVKEHLGVVPQETNLDGEFEVLDNLLVQASYFGVARGDALPRAERLLEFTQLAERARDSIESLSGGMKRRLLVARALINEPDIVVLDEPTTGLDPQARLAVWRAMEELKDQRRDAAAHHPLHGGGGAALRPAGDHGPGQDRRRGRAGRADPRARGGEPRAGLPRPHREASA